MEFFLIFVEAGLVVLAVLSGIDVLSSNAKARPAVRMSVLLVAALVLGWVLLHSVGRGSGSAS